MTARRYVPSRPIEIVAHPATGEPRRLRWRGRVAWVARVEATWAVDEGWWRGEPEAIRRRYYQLVTRNGLLYVVYRDLASGRWYLEEIID